MPNVSADQAPSLRAEVQPSTAKLGDVITLKVQTRQAPGQAVAPLALPKRLGTFEVLASTAMPLQREGSAETQQFLIQLQNFTTGQQLLPGVVFNYHGADGKINTIQTPEMRVNVELVPADPKDKAGDIRGIKGVIGPVPLSPVWWLLLAFAILVAGVALWSHRPKTVQGPPPAPPVPPEQTALEKLHDLKASGWIEDGKIKEFYSALSEILRAYIEAGFHCPALERTTSELMRDIRQKGFLPSDKALALKHLLEECDLVKFAKFRPDPSAALQAHAAAVQFVEKTRDALR